MCIRHLYKINFLVGGNAMTGICGGQDKSKPAEPLVDGEEIRLAILGMVDGNGHPYSWSAIFNGYNPEEMAKCPYPAIPAYLEKEPKETLRIKGARVTHIKGLNISKLTLYKS